jgi:hypothetical protein
MECPWPSYAGSREYHRQIAVVSRAFAFLEIHFTIVIEQAVIPAQPGPTKGRRVEMELFSEMVVFQMHTKESLCSIILSL